MILRCDKCGKELKPWEQFGPNILRPLCWEDWQASQNGGQMVLPETKAPELWDALAGDNEQEGENA